MKLVCKPIPTLLNNIIYELTKSNNVISATKYINQIKDIDISSLPNESKVTIQATLGLVALRNKEFELGKKLYELAISNSEKIKNQYLKNLATVNFARELIIAEQPEKDIYLEMVKNMKLDDKHKDLIELKKDTLGYLKK